MPDEFLDRTQPPTPRKLEEVRLKGIVSRSRDMTIAGMLCCSILMYYFLSQRISTELQGMSIRILNNLNTQYDKVDIVSYYLREWMLSIAQLLLFPLVIIFFLGVLFNVLQTGFIFSAFPLKPRWNNINIFFPANYKKYFSGSMWFKLFLGIVKIVAVVYASWKIIEYSSGLIFILPQTDMQTIANTIFRLAFLLSFVLGATYFVLGLIDLGFQKWKFMQELKMSPQEIKEERKQSEGNIVWKSKIETVMMKWADHRIRVTIPHANVVITNSGNSAVGIKYDPKNMLAPVCVASGRGKKAELITYAAQTHHVQIIENSLLADALYNQVKEGSPVPPSFYHEIASILTRAMKR